MAKTMISKYDGVCRDCGAELPAGSLIRWYGRGKVYGMDCHVNPKTGLTGRQAMEASKPAPYQPSDGGAFDRGVRQAAPAPTNLGATRTPQIGGVQDQAGNVVTFPLGIRPAASGFDNPIDQRDDQRLLDGLADYGKPATAGPAKDQPNKLVCDNKIDLDWDLGPDVDDQAFDSDLPL